MLVQPAVQYHLDYLAQLWDVKVAEELSRDGASCVLAAAQSNGDPDEIAAAQTAYDAAAAAVGSAVQNVRSYRDALHNAIDIYYPLPG